MSRDRSLDERALKFPLAASAFDSLVQLQAAYGAIVTAALRCDDDVWADMEARAQEIRHLCDDDPGRFRAGIEAWLEFS
jgi:hypothetical protein